MNEPDGATIFETLVESVSKEPRLKEIRLTVSQYRALVKYFKTQQLFIFPLKDQSIIDHFMGVPVKIITNPNEVSMDSKVEVPFDKLWEKLEEDLSELLTPTYYEAHWPDKPPSNPHVGDQLLYWSKEGWPYQYFWSGTNWTTGGVKGLLKLPWEQE